MMTVTSLLQNIEKDSEDNDHIVLTNFQDLNESHSAQIVAALVKKEKPDNGAVGRRIINGGSVAYVQRYISLDFAKIDSQNLPGLVACLNAFCSDPYYITGIRMKVGDTSIKTQQFVSQFCACIKRIHLPKYQERTYDDYCLEIHNLHACTIDEVMQVCEALASNITIKRVDMRANGFEKFSADEKLKIVNCLLCNPDLVRLDVSENGFAEIDSKTLEEHASKLKEEQRSISLELISFGDFVAHSKKTQDCRNPEEDFRLAKMHLHYKMLPSTGCSLIPPVLKLGTEHYKRLFREFYSAHHNNAKSALDYWMENDKNLDVKEKKEIEMSLLFAAVDHEGCYLQEIRLHEYCDEDLTRLRAKLGNSKVGIGAIRVDLSGQDQARVALLSACANALLTASSQCRPMLHIYANDLEANISKMQSFIRGVNVISSGNGYYLSLQDCVLPPGEIGFAMLMSLVDAIGLNPVIEACEFTRLNLAQFGAKLMDFVDAILTKTQLKRVGLLDNALATDKALLFNILRKLIGHDRIEAINTQCNQVTSLPLEDIEAIFTIFKPRLGKFRTDIWTSTEYAELFKRESHAHSYRVLMLRMLAEIRCSEHYTEHDLTHLQESEALKLLTEHVNLRLEFAEDPCYTVANWVMSAKSLSYESRLKLAWYTLEKLESLDIAAYDLKPEDRLKLFLTACGKGFDGIDPSSLKRANLYETDLPARQFFAPWQALEEDIQEGDNDAMADAIKERVLPQLFQAYTELSPNAALYQFCIDTLNRRQDKIDNSFEAMKFVNMVGWFTYACAMLVSKNYGKLMGFEKIFKEIIEYPDPVFRIEVTRILFEDILGQGERGVRVFQSVSAALRKPYLLLASIPLSKIIIEGDEKERNESEILASVAKLSKLMTRAYKDGYYFAPFLSAVKTLVNIKIPVATKFAIIIGVLEIKADNQPRKMLLQKASFGLVQGLAGLNDMEVLASLGAGDFSAEQAASFKRYFNVTDLQYQYFAETIAGQGLVPELFCYLSKIRSLSPAGRALMEPVFERYVKSILSLQQQDYEALRYSDENPHLKIIFKDRASLKGVWKAGIPRENLQAFVDDNKIQAEALVINFREMIENALLHHHLSLGKFQMLRKYLELPADKQRLLREQVRKDVGERKQKLAIMKKPGKNDAIAYYDEKALAYLEIELHLMEVIALPLHDKASQLRCLRIVKNKILKFCDQEREFLNDLNMAMENILEAMRPSKRVDSQGYQIGVTGDYLTTFRMGSVPGSCQRIEGNPNLNKGVMAVVMGGQNLLPHIIDSMKTLVARVILRLWRDQVVLKPVLFLEQMYPAMLMPLWRNALKTMAIMMAKFTKLTLLSLKGEPESRKYSYPVESLGNIAPYGYEDALHGIQEDDIYTIPQSYVLYSPHEEWLRKVLQVWFRIPVDKEQKKIINKILEFYANDGERFDAGLVGDEAPPKSRALYFQSVKSRQAQALLPAPQKPEKRRIMTVYHV